MSKRRATPRDDTPVQVCCSWDVAGYDPIMETCPHGARIEVHEDTQSLVFIDPCPSCTELLADLGFPAPKQLAAPAA